jgi:hypothetical protein
MVKSWKKRWFVLRGNTLSYYKEKEVNSLLILISTQSPEALGFIPLDKASVLTVESTKFGKSYCFEIIDPSNSFNRFHKSFFLCATDQPDMITWMEAIGTAKIEDIKIDAEKKITSPKTNEKLPATMRSICNFLFFLIIFLAMKNFQEVTNTGGEVDLPKLITKLIKYLDHCGINSAALSKMDSIETSQKTALLQELLKLGMVFTNCKTLIFR